MVHGRLVTNHYASSIVGVGIANLTQVVHLIVNISEGAWKAAFSS